MVTYMAISVIGGASIDENGHAYGGKAGDQNGREVYKKNWYKHPKGWVVLRPNDPTDAEIIASTMDDICDNDYIGYDQYQRTSLLKLGLANGWNAAIINSKTECDCSKAIQFCLFAAGIKAGTWDDGFRTGNMIPTMMATGRFTKLTESKYVNSSANLKRGDVLVTKTSGHTVAVITDGVNISRKLGDRPLRKGSSGDDVKCFQNDLKILGYGSFLGKWGENKDGCDGDYGNDTMKAVKAFEKDHGLTQDGISDLTCIKMVVASVTEKLTSATTTDDDDDPPDDTIGDDTPDTTTGATVPETLPDYKCLWAIATSAVNVRTGPGTSYQKKIALYPGTGLVYAGETKDGWYAVLYRGKKHWVSSKLTKLEVREKYILDISTYDDIDDWATLAKYVSYIWIRVACRRDTNTGEVYVDAKFKQHAANCEKYGIPFGVYVYGRASTKAGGIQEARKAVGWAEPYGPTTYMYDIEAPTLTHVSCQAFIDETTTLTGKPCGIYVGIDSTQKKYPGTCR